MQMKYKSWKNSSEISIRNNSFLEEITAGFKASENFKNVLL